MVPLCVMDRRVRVALVLLPILLALLVLWLHGPIVQDPGYHDFADQREVFGVPHFGDVVTNLAFVVVGAWGLCRRPPVDYAVFALGVLLTGFGSTLYHLEPTDASLAWDRAPMTLAFLGLTAAVIRERVSATWGRRLLWPLVAFGLWAVWYWTQTGDLRPYALAQYAPLLSILLMLVLFPGPSRGLGWAGLGYAAAKALELLDRPIHAATAGLVSGHNLKHLAAALAAAAIVGAFPRGVGRSSVSGPDRIQAPHVPRRRDPIRHPEADPGER